MLAGLRHDSLVGGNYEQCKIDPGGAGDHRMDQPFVAGHIHKVELDLVIGKLGKTEVDGDPSFAFLRQTITIGPGERLDESGFPVIDMTRSAPNDVSHGRHGTTPRLTPESV